MSENEKELLLSKFLKCSPEDLIGSEKKLFDVLVAVMNEKDYYKRKYEELKQKQEFLKNSRDCYEEFEL